MKSATAAPDTKAEHNMENHAPELNYLCSDPDCCDNGCPRVRCTQCGRMWPCLTWQESHSAKQLAAKRRWVLRKHFPGDEDMTPYPLANPATWGAEGAGPE